MTTNDVNVGVVVTDVASDITPIIPSPPHPTSSPSESSVAAATAVSASASHNSIDDDDDDDAHDAAGLAIALDQAERGLAQGGIPIGSALLTSAGDCLGSGHNMRVQRGSPTLHAEMAALEHAGRLSAPVYRDCTLVGVPFHILSIKTPFSINH